MIGVILAAGRGTRMRPYSNAVNKEMVLVGKYPVIEYIVRALTGSGVRKIIIVVSEGKSQISNYFQDGSDFGASIAYVYQDFRKGEGTAKAVQAVEEWVSGSFIMVYGDSFFYPTGFFKEMVGKYGENGEDALLAVYPMREFREYGLVKTSGGRVLDILEKVDEEKAGETMVDGYYPVNSGPMIFSEKVFSYIRRVEPSSSGEYWITDAIRLMARERRVTAYFIPGSVFRRDIGRMSARLEAERFILEKEGGENSNVRDS